MYMKWQRGRKLQTTSTCQRFKTNVLYTKEYYIGIIMKFRVLDDIEEVNAMKIPHNTEMKTNLF